MIYRALADAILIAHLAFVAFVVLGAFAVVRWPRVAWLHVPAGLWGILIEYGGWICPLTPLEVALRRRGGQVGYAGGFIEHYVTAVIYPGGLTRRTQLILGSLALGVNLLVYAHIVSRRRRPTNACPSSSRTRSGSASTRHRPWQEGVDTPARPRCNHGPSAQDP